MVTERTGDESGAWRVMLCSPEREAFVFVRGSRTESGVWRMIIDADDPGDFILLREAGVDHVIHLAAGISVKSLEEPGFVFVGDVARANYLACISETAPGEVFNISSGRSISVNELAQLLINVTGRQVEVVHDKPTAGEIKHSVSDGTKAREVSGFASRTRFEEGLKQVVGHAANEVRT